jgi:hypothetical protein
MLRKFVPILLLGMLLHPAVSPSQVPCSDCLKLFNQGGYAAAASCFQACAQGPGFGAEWNQYFLGESLYNLGLGAKDAASARKSFDEAGEAFEKVRQILSVANDNPYVYDQAACKKAWCLFRQAETSDSPQNLLVQAKQAFSRCVSSSSIRDIRLSSAYMLGESSLRLGIDYRTNGLLSNDFTSAQNAAIEFNSAAAALSSVLDSADASSAVKIAAQIRLRDARFEHALLYLHMPQFLFDRAFNDPMRKTTALQTILGLLDAVSYAPLRGLSASSVRPYLAHSELLASLHRYLYSGAKPDLDRLDALLAQPDPALTAVDLGLVAGVRDSRNLVETMSLRDREVFFNTCRSIIGRRLGPAAPSSPEAAYWKGFLESIVELNDCESSYGSVLAQLGSRPMDARRRMLRDAAQFQLYRYRFERSTMDLNLAGLRALSKDLDAFRPATLSLEPERDLLAASVYAILQPDKVWEYFRQVPTDRRADKVLGIIQMLLKSAGQVVGPQRQRILDRIPPLFKFTENMKPNDTRFSRALWQFLNSEIQPSKAELTQRFIETAGYIGNTISGTDAYRFEEQYLQARSLLAAEKFDEAEKIFIRLINEDGSLRSAFFLGEIQRICKNKTAANQCFEEVKRATAGKEGGELWYKAAESSQRAMNDISGGSAGVLDGVRFGRVQFPEDASKWGVAGIETDAVLESIYQKTEKLAQGLAEFAKFGLPKQGMYPSQIRPPGSRFADDDYDPGRFNAGIFEKIGAVTSKLKVTVLMPAGAAVSGISVRLNDQVMTLDSTGSCEREFTMGEKVNVQTSGAGYYPTAESFVVTQPKSVSRVILPEERFDFARIDGYESVPLVQFSGRFDGNAVFFEGGAAALAPTALYRQFNENVLLRDFARSAAHQGVLAVTASGSILPVFKGADLEEQGGISLAADSATLKSPEGLAVDSEGLIYIVDLKQDRILIFRADGSFDRAFGTTGENTQDDVGKPARFARPCRICVVRDVQGVLHEGQRYIRKPKLIVTDRNGAYFLDDQGNYLTTVFRSPEPKGCLSAVTATGYGDECRVSIYNRSTGNVLQLKAEHRALK